MLLGFAVLVYGWSVWLFVNRGRGTPLPVAPPRELVVQDPYRYIRNPMALAVVAGATGSFWRVIRRILQSGPTLGPQTA
jgi:protein-S-isoprenylcysteine O-methyltransferase Ste14